jgi:hypothetical protein
MAILGRQVEVTSSALSSEDTDMSFRLKCGRNWGRGQKVCMFKQSYSNYNLVAYYLKSGLVRYWRSFII